MGTIGRQEEFGFVAMMKRRAALPLYLSVSLTACFTLMTAKAAGSAGARASASGDLIVNGGFENGLAGWEYDPEFQIASDKAAAHSGAASIQVEVTREAKWRTLKQKVQVRKGASYTLDVWIRGQAGAPRLWVVQPGAEFKDRVAIGSLKNTGKDWDEIIATFTAAADGEAEILIIINRFKDAAKAHVWIDDVSLVESKTANVTPVSGGAGVNDEPAMARASDGSLYVAWVSFRDGCDTLQVARYTREGEAVRQQKSWQLAGGKGAYVLWPRVVAAGGGVYVLYSSEVKGVWRIVAVPCGAEGPGVPLTITDGGGAGVNEKPAGAWSDDALWVAWEGNRNQCRQIFAASVRDGKASAAEALSRPGVSSYDPAIAALAPGSMADARVAVAWHSFIDNNYDIYLRVRSAQGEWEAERRLTKAPAIDRHAELAARGGDLWIVYENAQMKADYSIGGTKSQGLVVARVGTEGLESPASAGKSPVAAKSVAAAPVFDDRGRLWIAFQRPTDREWFPYLAGFNGGGWEPARLLSSKKASIERRAPVAIDGDRAIIAFQTDNLAGRYKDEQEATQFVSDVFLTCVDLKNASPAAAPTSFQPLAESAEEFAPGTLRVGYGEENHGPSIEYKGQKLNLYYGDLHDHTNVSICGRTHDEAIDEAYQDMRDITHLDFACVTDHGYNQTPYLWNYTAKMARVNEDPGRFLTFLAEEWTSTFEQTDADHPFGYYGHRNLIFADPYFPRWWNEMNSQTPAQVWEELRKMKANFVYIPHQLADNGNVPTDWKFADEVAQPVAEIFQGRGSYEYRGAPRQAKNVVPSGKYFLQDAWAMGVVIGVIASPDHSGGKGKACVYAPSLTREAILDALRARHCFGTTAAKIFLDVRVNGALMGEKIAAPSGKPVEVKVVARGAGDIAKIEVCRNNKFIYTTTPASREAGFTYVDQTPLSEPSYYYVRLIQKDEEIAWSSPVWLGFGGSSKTN